MKHRTHVLKVTVYEAYCDDCDWTTQRSAGDPDAGSDRQARRNAFEAAYLHRGLHLRERVGA